MSLCGADVPGYLDLERKAIADARKPDQGKFQRAVAEA